MNIKEFKKTAKERGIPDFLYNIDGKGRDDERLCLVQYNGQWNVYYSERGCKTTNRLFNTEDEALRYILEELSD